MEHIKLSIQSKTHKNKIWWKFFFFNSKLDFDFSTEGNFINAKSHDQIIITIIWNKVHLSKWVSH